jgi:hypothetical protein
MSKVTNTEKWCRVVSTVGAIIFVLAALAIFTVWLLKDGGML